MNILWTVIIGFIVGIVAKFIAPGSRAEPSGFVLTALLGIMGAIAATYLGQAIGLYSYGESAGFVGAVIGAILVMVIWGAVSRRA